MIELLSLATSVAGDKNGVSMSRFYFHVSNGSGFTEDREGEELADADEARAVATRAAREIMAADVRDGELDLTSLIRVEDQAGVLLFQLEFEHAIKVTGKHGRLAAAKVV